MIAYLAFLGVLLATGIDIALPAFDAIEASLGSTSRTPLIITVYLLGMAGGQLVYGPVSDRFGRRPAVLAGLVLYLLGSVAAALAPSFAWLLVARLLWGLGAAAPAGLRSAITRDLYQGDKMARIATIMMAVFLLGPVFVPLLGELLIRTGPWRSIFWFPAGLAVVGAVWCVRFGETLPVERRRPLDAGQLRQGVRTVLRTRVTVGHLAANVFLSGAFFIFLGSAQPVFDRVYGRSSQFAALFALTGVLTIPPLLLNNRLIGRFGARRMSVLTCAGSASLACAALVPVLLWDGHPPFWSWYVWLVIVAGLLTLSTPSIIALALEPMGELAGTASSLLFFSGLAFGALLAAIFDSLVVDSVTPFVAGFALYSSIGFSLLWAAGPPRTGDSATAP